VEILVRDSQSDPNRAAEVASRLILSDKVDLMLVASTPETTNPVSDQCEVNGTPCVSTVAPWQPWFFARGGKPEVGFKSTYHFFWGLEDIIGVFVDMWNSLPTNKVVGALWPNDGDGNAWSDKQRGFPPALAQAGYKVVDPGRYPNLTDDFSAQISTFKNEKVEIVTGVPLPPDWTTFWKQAAQQGFRPKIATVGKALLFPRSVEALGDLGDGMSTEVWWTPHHPFKSSLTGTSAAAYAAAYTRETKKQWTQPLGFIHALFEVGLDVTRRAASLDKGAMVAAIKATNLNTIVGPISWARGPVPNVTKTPLVGGQWGRGKDFPFDMTIVSNRAAPSIPTAGKLRPLSA
jgi:branched-chain amino acid transport system substrate-binding protein